MKKVFFSILAVVLLSNDGFAEKHKSAKKKRVTRSECPAACPKTMDCSRMHS